MTNPDILSQTGALAIVAVNKLLNDDKIHKVEQSLLVPNYFSYSDARFVITIERWITQGEHGGGYKWVRAEEYFKEYGV